MLGTLFKSPFQIFPEPVYFHLFQCQCHLPLFWLCILLACLQGAYIIIKVSYSSQKMLHRLSSAPFQSPQSSLCIRTTLMQSYRPVLSSSHFTWDYKRITGPAWDKTPSETYALVYTEVRLPCWPASTNWFYWPWQSPYFGDMKQPVEHEHHHLP